MKPVKQTKLWTRDGIHNGNCLAAAVASLLELPLWMVPPFEDMFGRGTDSHIRMRQWLFKVHGLKFVVIDGHQVDKLPEFYMVTGKSPRGVHHAVIYSGGKLVHDPHPSDAGVESVLYTQHLVPVTEQDVTEFEEWSASLQA